MSSAGKTRLVFLGPPGAGKGTQAVSIADELGVPHVSTGDILRAAVKADSPLGREAHRYMNAGELVPDELVNRMVAERLTQADCTNGFLLDGFPRTLVQGRALEEALKGMKTALNAVITFDVPRQELIRRLTGRRACSECGANYHIESLKPKVEGICDRCGAKLVQRADDSIETVENRLEVYQRQTADLIDYYRSRNLLKEVPGDLTIEEVHRHVLEALK